MKKLLIRIGMVLAMRIGMILVMLVVLNWVYATWFFEKDLRKHSDIVELSWDVTDDSCRIIYLGESSNNHYGDEETNHRKISDFTADYFPTVKMGDLTKSASHAQTYLYMLKHIPASSSVETVVVTMNMRSFGPLWIYSKLETALRKQLVLLEDHPPLVNRFLLAFKIRIIRTMPLPPSKDCGTTLRLAMKRAKMLSMPLPVLKAERPEFSSSIPLPKRTSRRWRRMSTKPMSWWAMT